jgi:hypothetical protein
MQTSSQTLFALKLRGGSRLVDALVNGALILLVALGLVYRFGWVNWSKGTNLHPDEYGLTNTLTQLSLPKNLADYFNTRISPLSPYQKYDAAGSVTVDGPDNRMRWGQLPMILIRTAAELTGNTGYGELRLMGRTLSALADALAVLIIFAIGRRLFNPRIGLLAATLSSLAVMQIQQSHFMTVDNFASLFAVAALYACVRIAQQPSAMRAAPALTSSAPTVLAYRPSHAAITWFLLFGMFFGMTVASKINLLPVGGMVLIAVLISIADLKLKTRQDLTRILLISAGFLALAYLAALVTFRLAQPMSFRAVRGDTTFITVKLNSDWIDSMKVAQSESSGIGGGPPGEQWAQRPKIIFPLVNIVLWGLGLPLGITAWVSVLWATWRLARGRVDWRAHLLPLVWVLGYFLFMGTRWVMSIRYFLPIYPFLCLYAAWGLAELLPSGTWWNLWKEKPRPSAAETPPPRRRRVQVPAFLRTGAPIAAALVVILGTLAWATAFVNAVYWHDPTRVQATEWIFQNVPAPFNLTIEQAGVSRQQPVAAPDGLQVSAKMPFIQAFTASYSGRLTQAAVPHAFVLSSSGDVPLRIAITTDPDGQNVLDEALLTVRPSETPATAAPVTAAFHQAVLEQGKLYYLVAAPLDSSTVLISRTVVANENWDEGLPVPYDGYDPFGQFYTGLTMEVRWSDDENKRRMFIDTLQKIDYIILPSQRAIWSTCRIPRTYPMTMEYYRALFAGHLGFDLAATFSAPLKIGPLKISDVGGTIAWNRAPPLPLFNHNLLAAEEAFSVYDHPPVWVFKKRADFDIHAVRAVLDSIDLNQVIIQQPRDATGSPCR